MKLKDVVKKFVTDWMEHWDQGRIRERVFSILDSRRDEVILKMAGFDDRWGKWEIDHCNGRMASVSKYIESIAQDVVKEWIDNNIDTFPKMTEELQVEILNEYKQIYLRNIERYVTDQSYDEASRTAVSLVAKFMQDYDFENMDIDTPEEKELWKYES